MIIPPWKLTARGVLGINSRNADYVRRYNPRKLYPLVDDKLQTKALARQAGVAVPQLYGVIRAEHQMRWLPRLLEKVTDFVIKPVHGSGGKGVLVIIERLKARYRKADGELIDQEEIGHHVFNTLSGLYSLGGQPDQAMIEYRVRFDPMFKPISYLGVPDVRLVVFRGYPVMSMVRLPTRLSDGKANLHQGALGVGIDLATGVTLGGVYQGRPIAEHPDTGNPVSGIRIPHWENLLEMAARCHDLAGLGYLGVDVVLDEELGPLLLELNARPGLGIQLANRVGLQSRLARIEALEDANTTPKERVEVVKSLFRSS